MEPVCRGQDKSAIKQQRRMKMRIEGVERAKSYDLWGLAEAARMPVEEVRQLVERGHLESHYTDDELYVNGKDFLAWAEKQKGNLRHYE